MNFSEKIVIGGLLSGIFFVLFVMVLPVVIHDARKSFKWPLWVIRLRNWLPSHADDWGGLLLIVIVVVLTWVGLIISRP